MTPAERGRRAGEVTQKFILGVIAGGAAAIGVVEVVLLIVRVAGLLGDEAVTVAGIPLASPLEPDFAAGLAAVTAASYDSVTLTIAGLVGSARGALVGAAIVTSLLSIAVCAVVAWLALRVFLGRPFVTSASWGIGLVAVLAISVGFLQPMFLGFAHAEIAQQLGTDALPTFLVELDPAPIAWGLALAVVGAAFELGQRMQRDTEGLV
ncbi:hypothetical protein M2152_000023 [Microbacteriaceae bacterium SG_E_30_P1]|uniref:DUF2975 domain-containing protein n=1 Tax=Antiquaquibacter oligotrophicus TaxID=2880260 RepID=A0ABT6KIX0_9MICO|nr:hypothetical protein [Antiquaquibacter oligotrophicus]MDH6179841.1 hypothetical protein [Antiquaquibacter oligotrophicus]UDF14398.1 hypothetical protein LH407_05920 [Antiquaquibacter oligotrophicus]